MTKPMSVDEALDLAMGLLRRESTKSPKASFMGALVPGTCRAGLEAVEEHRSRLAEQREELRRVREEMARVSFHGGVEPDHQIVAAWKRVVNRWLAALDRVIGGME